MGLNIRTRIRIRIRILAYFVRYTPLPQNTKHT